jgi:acyl carrier protein
MNIFNELQEVFNQNLSMEGELKQDAPITDYIKSSIDFIKIIVGIETKFDVEFGDDDLQLDRFKLVSDLIDFIEKKTE